MSVRGHRVGDVVTLTMHDLTVAEVGDDYLILIDNPAELAAGRGLALHLSDDMFADLVPHHVGHNCPRR